MLDPRDVAPSPTASPNSRWVVVILARLTSTSEIAHPRPKALSARKNHWPPHFFPGPLDEVHERPRETTLPWRARSTEKSMFKIELSTVMIAAFPTSISRYQSQLMRANLMNSSDLLAAQGLALVERIILQVRTQFG
ncbi:hypothetical protein NL676_009678 [Syzygium grande]|nr:hypothetical protein NL676_009678 [Syzygium grande]